MRTYASNSVTRFAALVLLSIVFFTSSAGAESFKVGALLNLTGFGARWGENARRGIELAQEQINASGGIAGRTVQVVFEDTRSGDLAACATAVQKLINVDRVQVVLTQWTGDTEIAWSIASRSGIPVLAVSAGAPGLTRGKPSLFSLWGEDEALLEEIVQFLDGERLVRPALIVTQDPYFLTLAERLRRLLEAKGVALVLQREVLPDTTQFRSEALRVKSAQADSVLSFLYLPQQADFVKNLRALKAFPQVFGVIGSDEPKFFELAGEAANGVLVPMYAESNKKFTEQFQNRWHAAPWLSADTAYDALMLIAKVNSSHPQSNVNFAEAIGLIKGYQGASGDISFRHDGVRLARPTRMLRLQATK